MSAITIKEQFEIPGKLKTWAYALIGFGLLAIIAGYITKGRGTEE